VGANVDNVGGFVASRIVVESEYDSEGNRTRTTRRWRQGSGAFAPSLVTTYEYDRVDRLVKQVEPDTTFTTTQYDPAGNATSVQTRRGSVLTMEYDLLNRLTTRVIPSPAPYTYPLPNLAPAIAFENAPYVFGRPPETQTFTYDATGQIANATALDADVQRTYHPDGALLTETQRIRNRARTATPHVFTLTNQYDRNGRRTSLRLDPAALFAGDSIRYRYATWGALASVRDIAGAEYSFGYNARGELDTLRYPGGAVESVGYDGASRLQRDRIIRTGSLGFPFPGTTTLRDFTVTRRNARGQVLRGTDPALVGSAIPFTEVNEFGYLTVDSMVARGYVLVGGNAAVYRSTEQITYTPLGDITQRAGGWGLPPQAQSFSTTNSYDDLRRLTRQTGELPTWYRYDEAGSVRLERTQDAFGVGGDNDAAGRIRERAAFYGADDRLLASDLRTAAGGGKPASRFLEEYRYDALGRRVWVSTRKQCAGAGGLTAECLSSLVRRTIWDGPQELAEIQVPLDTFANTPVGTEELNANVPVIPAVTCPALDPCDPNPFYGRVVYGPGLAIDQPLSVTRYGYQDNVSGSSLTWPTYGLSVFWNDRGTPAYGLFTDGAEFRPHTPSPGQSACPALQSTATDRCVKLQWPFAQSAYDRAKGRTPPGSWQGTLLANKVDGTGLEYARNRVYDAQTGRFTQEDPIGLAGGVNAYGFANGDPATFSDPFGLFACPPSCEGAIQQIGRMLQPVQGPLEAIGALATVPLGGGMGMLGGSLTSLGVAAHSGLTGTALARSMGAAGEVASGIARNAQRIPSATGTAMFRVPDGLTATTLSEVKNVASLSLTNQLRDFSAFAQRTGRTFELYVRPTTELTRPLQRFIRDNNIVLKTIK
jgi:RHS repeat-associated protein